VEEGGKVKGRRGNRSEQPPSHMNFGGCSVTRLGLATQPSHLARVTPRQKSGSHRHGLYCSFGI